MSLGLNIRRNSFLTTEQSTRASGKTVIDTVMEFKFGLMEPNMKATGRTTRPTAKESSGTQMEMCLTVSGKRTKHTVMEYTFTLMELSMKENGKMTCSMAKESKFGPMAPNMMAITKTVRN